MKRSLLFVRSAVSGLYLCFSIFLNGQEVIFSEDFSGFTTGTHSSPATNDVSGALDPKTHMPGWTGSKIYSAGGEIKLGTLDIPGWIETPLISMSGYEGDLFIKFDISRWPGDATTVRVYLNGNPIGNEIIPADAFQTIQIPITIGTVSGKIRFESMTKRFYLDNVILIAGNTTSIRLPDKAPSVPGIYPNPACNFVNINNIEEYNRLEISDISGRVLKVMDLFEGSGIEVSLDHFSSGIYIIRFRSDKKTFTTRFIIKKGIY